MITFFTGKQIIRYTLMPELFSRIRVLAFGGFGTLSYLVAILYNLVRLLPDNHAYLDARNMGRFGIRHVVAEAANNLVLSRERIDQVVMFFAILLGMVVILVQFCMLFLSLLMMPAMAGWLFSDVFVVANPRQDIAYIMLDLIFGIPAPGSVLPVGGGSFFGSCVGAMPPTPCLNASGMPILDPDFSTITVPGFPAAPVFSPLSSAAPANFPFPIHFGMRALFGMYNFGLLIVALMIMSYFVATVIAETAQSGTPFGKRYNKMWAPIRMVLAIGLLLPFGGLGYNASQYIVLYAAKYGSAFATNGWDRFTDTLFAADINPLNGEPADLMSIPTEPDMSGLAAFMWLVNVCAEIHRFQTPGALTAVRPYVVGQMSRATDVYEIGPATTLQDALTFLSPSRPKAINIRFGLLDTVRHRSEIGYVKPTCGELQFPLTDPRRLSDVPGPSLGVSLIQNFYFNLVRDMWFENTSPSLPDSMGSPQILAEALSGGGGRRAAAFAYNGVMGSYPACCTEPLTAAYVSAVNGVIREGVDLAIIGAVNLQASPLETNWLAGPCSFNDPALNPLKTPNRGWGAAGVFYNCIAEMNGSMTGAVSAVPSPTVFPEAMENIASIKAAFNANTGGVDQFEPILAGVADPKLKQNLTGDAQMAVLLYEAMRMWGSSNENSQTVAKDPITSAISIFLGVNGLYDMRRNTTTHPLAQLVGIGRSLVEAAIRKMGYSIGAAATAAGINAAGGSGQLVGVAASMLVTVAMLGLTSGFVLFYIVPFLPFIYFFFALGGWVKGIFEAMVGAPLWALAHIRIDGHGLPGNAAMNGYFLIFEIFIRPILTIFGLIASVVIFSALVAGLNTLFTIVVYNTSGFNLETELTGPPADSVIQSMRGTIDEFFYTIIYAVVVYMMAMSSFKLIDQIPNNILRWMGQSVATFGDTREDPAAGLMSRAGSGAQQAFSRFGSGMSGMVGAISSSGK